MIYLLRTKLELITKKICGTNYLHCVENIVTSMKTESDDTNFVQTRRAEMVTRIWKCMTLYR